MSSTFNLLCLSVLLFALAATNPSAGKSPLTCDDVTRSLVPCLSFLENGFGKPSAACCGGVKTLKQSATTTADRQMACKCMKQTAKSIPAIKINVAAQVPTQCGVQIPYAVSFNTDCARVK